MSAAPGLMRWDPVHDSREAFLACLRAQCAPGTWDAGLPRPEMVADAGLDAAAAVLLALLDPGVVLGAHGDEATTRLAEQVAHASGATLGPVENAHLVLVRGDTEQVVAQAKRGGPTDPENGATVVLVAGDVATAVVLEGPGIPDRRRVDLPVDAATLDAFAEASAGYPCGVDLLVVAPAGVLALPRSVRVTPAVA